MADESCSRPKLARQCDITRHENAVKRRARVCAHCGKQFQEGSRSSKQVAAGAKQKFCSRLCSTSAQTQYASSSDARRAEYARRRERDGLPPAPPPPASALCAECGEMFKPRLYRQCCCSTECSDARSRRQSVEHSKAHDARNRIARPCRECGMLFEPEYGNKRRNFCSELCLNRHCKRIGKAVRRARKRGATSEPVDPFKVFARDRWVCHLCHTKTNKKMRGTCHPDAPELDHVVSLADGGAHTYANTACSHRRCNAAKGSRSIGQLRMFG